MPVTTQTAGRVQWLEWGRDVFERAKREDKLILLDSGATWCHWCHVMDRVTYEDPQVVELLNEKFIPVRIDRDRLPEVDAHYQRAAPLIGPGGSGWPLTALITPEGHILFKATFLPPRADGRYARGIGLIEALEQLDEYWRGHRRQVAAAADRVRRLTREQPASALARPAALSAEQVDAVAAGIKDAYDPRHGGFGGAPKFFSAPAIELLLVRAWSGDASAADMATGTLEGMMRGGVHDQLGGGFHRYSVDERWHVPHFEKMAYDNAALLSSYANAYALTGRDQFARVARRTLAWISRVLAAPDGRGFYASQDADVGPSDDGDYFTWTVDEVRSALGAHSDEVLSFYGVDGEGDVHGRPGRNVLHTPKTLAQQGALTGVEQSRLAAAIEAASARLLQARLKRAAPAVDKTVFADLNGMMIDAHLTAYERLGDRAARDTALKTLNRLLRGLRDDRGRFAHYREGGELRGIGMLADQAWMLRALVHAYAATVDPEYLQAARKVGDYITGDLVAADGGLLTAPAPAAAHPAAIVPARRWEDAPSRSTASVAAQALIDLEYLSGEHRYSSAAAGALRSLAGAIDRRMGTFLAGWATAAEHHQNGPRTIVVVGPHGGVATEGLARAARAAYVPGGLIIVLDPENRAHAELLKRLGYAARAGPVAYVCRGKTCLKPAESVKELNERVAELAGGAAPGS